MIDLSAMKRADISTLRAATYERRESLRYVAGNITVLNQTAAVLLARVRKELTDDLHAIDAELTIRRSMGLGTAPLVAIQDAPTSIAS